MTLNVRGKRTERKISPPNFFLFFILQSTLGSTLSQISLTLDDLLIMFVTAVDSLTYQPFNRSFLIKCLQFYRNIGQKPSTKNVFYSIDLIGLFMYQYSE